MSLGLLKLGLAHKSVLTSGGGGTPVPLQVPYTQGFWHDASDADTISIATGVSQWDDKFTDGLHLTQATGALQPAYGTRTHNGLNVVDFTSSRLVWPSDILDIAEGPSTLFLVMISDLASGSRNIVHGEGASGTARWSILTFNTTIQCRVGTSTAVSPGQQLTTDVLHIMGFRREGTTVEAFMNGVKGTPNASAGADITLTAASVGSNTAGTNLYDGVIAETMAWRDYVDDTNMNLVGEYLAAKWAGTWTGF